MADPTLYRLLSWLSPSYPVGAFAYSHGIEWMVETGAVKDEASLTAWIDDLLSHGGPWSDAVAFSHAFDAGNDLSALRNINEFVVAMAPSEERHLETTTQGNAFLKTTLDAWSWDDGAAVARALGRQVAYPVAVAVVAHGHKIIKEDALHALLHGVAANLVSAGVRLIPLGQTAGQRALAALEGTVDKVRSAAGRATFEDIGGIAMISDIAAMKHETQYTRLFRS